MVVYHVASRRVDGSKDNLTQTSKASVIILISLFSLTSFPLATIGGTATGCTPRNAFCANPISFDRNIVANSSDLTFRSSLTSPVFSIDQNESMLVSAQADVNSGNGNVTTVTDLFSTAFTELKNVGTTHGVGLAGGFLSVWYAKFASPAAIDQVTVTWNLPDLHAFIVSLYHNVGGTGNITGVASTTQVNTLSTTLTTTKSGSWIYGTAGSAPSGPSGDNCQIIFTTTPFVTRTNTCGVPGSSIALLQADNATSLRNNFPLTFTVTNTVVGGVPENLIELELLPNDLEPNQIVGACTPSNNPCATSLNVVARNGNVPVKATGLALNTAYCTGITTTALTLAAANSVLGWGEYGGVATNNTGATLLVQFYISSSVPSTTFGVGLCAAGTVIGSTVLNLPITGALNANRTQVLAVNAYCPTQTCNSVGPWYGFYEITPRDFALGSLGWDQLASGACANICLDSITMMEVK